MTNKKETRYELELTVLNDFIKEITQYRNSLLEEEEKPGYSTDFLTCRSNEEVQERKEGFALHIHTLSNKLKKIAVFSESMTGLI